jgi:30S ribosomal protein S31
VPCLFYFRPNLPQVTADKIKQIKKINIMGRGDIKTKKGKITKGSFGNIRPAKPNKAKTAAPAPAAAKKED